MLIQEKGTNKCDVSETELCKIAMNVRWVTGSLGLLLLTDICVFEKTPDWSHPKT